MKLDFDYEVNELCGDLKVADGYLDCETIILANIKRHINNNIPVSFIEGYLKKLQEYFEDKMVINRGNENCVNYRYAAGFLKTIISTPYWHSWIKTSD
ncbi:MAG: hypothetical protein JST58_03430 [Bacteroidetes bacterium]|nr:hypothetical protein [Bacteroidota bacterium]